MMMMMMMIGGSFILFVFNYRHFVNEKSSPRPLNNWKKVIDEIKERKEKEKFQWFFFSLFLIFYMAKKDKWKWYYLLDRNSRLSTYEINTTFDLIIIKIIRN